MAALRNTQALGSDIGSNPASPYINHGTSHTCFSPFSESLQQPTGYLHMGFSTSSHSCCHPAGTLHGSSSPTCKACPRVLHHSTASLLELCPSSLCSLNHFITPGSSSLEGTLLPDQLVNFQSNMDGRTYTATGLVQAWVQPQLYL